MNSNTTTTATAVRTATGILVTFPDGTTATENGKRAKAAAAVSIGQWSSDSRWAHGTHGTEAAAAKHVATYGKPHHAGGAYWLRTQVLPVIDAEPAVAEVAEVAEVATELVHGGSHTTRTVHLARRGGYDGERLVRVCGMNRRDSAYLYATDEAVTCKRCLALDVPEAEHARIAAALGNIAADLDGAELVELPAEVVEAEAAAQAEHDAAEVATTSGTYAYAIKQASIGAGKWFVTETTKGVEAVVGSVYGYATEAEAREVADRMAAPSHLDAIEAQEAADIAADDARRVEELTYLRRTYGEACARLVQNGWTVDSAISHVSGTCDLEACTGDHGHAWAVLVAEVTGRPEAAQAERDAELARSMAAVRDAAVAAGRQDVVEALDKLEHAKAVADYAADRGDYSAVQATAAKLVEGERYWALGSKLACRECSSRTTLVAVAIGERANHDAWHDRTLLVLPEPADRR